MLDVFTFSLHTATRNENMRASFKRAKNGMKCNSMTLCQAPSLKGKSQCDFQSLDVNLNQGYI